MTAITHDLAEFVAGISYDTLPVEVRERVKALALEQALDIGALLRLTRPDTTSGRRVAAAGH